MPAAHTGAASPRRFFSGHAPTFEDIAANVDVRRSVDFGKGRLSYDTLIDLLRDPADGPRLAIVFGEGGSGKTTLLRRLMYDLAVPGVLVLRCVANSFSLDDIESLSATYRATSTYVFADDASRVAASLAAAHEELSLARRRIVIIGAARRNEWNSATRTIRGLRFDSFFLPKLSDHEAVQLLATLEAHGSLGALGRLPPDARLHAFTAHSDNQLLVGLLEATRGSRLQDIVVDEYRGIDNPDVSMLYLAICGLSRIRAEIPTSVGAAVARASDTFDFNTRILPLLELVIATELTPYGPRLLPRHRVIGDELVRQVCKTPQEQLATVFEVLRRLRDCNRADRNIKAYAARLGRRLLASKLLRSGEDAVEVVELILHAGIGETSGAQHRLRPQRGARDFRFFQDLHHPEQAQFVAGVTILREFGEIRDAHALIDYGLGVSKHWGRLWLQRAILEFEAGETERADESIALLLEHQREDDRDLALPANLAVEISKFRARTDKPLALRYLEMGARSARPGMDDSAELFLHYALALETATRHAEAIATIRRGLSLVSRPPWAREKLEFLLFQRLTRFFPEDLWTEIHARYPERPYPSHIERCILRRAVALRTIADLETLRESPRMAELVSTELLAMAAAPTSDIEFLFDMIDPATLGIATTRALVNVFARRNDTMRLERLKAARDSTSLMLTYTREVDDPGARSSVLFVLGDERAQNEAIRSTVLRALSADAKPAVTSAVDELTKVKNLPADLALEILSAAIGSHREDVAACVIKFLPNPQVHRARLYNILLKDGNFRTLEILDALFGCHTLPAWVGMFLLETAIVENCRERAVHVLQRVTVPSEAVEMLHRRRKDKWTQHDEDFVASALSELGALTEVSLAGISEPAEDGPKVD